MRNDASSGNRLTIRTAFFAAALALLFVALPKGADAIVFADQQQLDQAWNAEVVPLFEENHRVFTDARELSDGEITAAFGASTGADLILVKSLSSARIYAGLSRFGANAESMIGDIPFTRLASRGFANDWATLCRRMGEVSERVTRTLVPAQKRYLDLQFKTDPTHDFTEQEIFGVLASDVTWFSQGAGGVYIGNPYQLTGSMLGDVYWTDDANQFRHPCVQAWLIAVIASRPETHANPHNTHSYWQDPNADLYFKSIPIPDALCTQKNLAPSLCFPRADYDDQHATPADGAALTNIGLVKARLEELIRNLQDRSGALEAPVAAAEAARAAEEARLEALRTAALGRGSVLTLPLPLSNISIPGVIGRVLNAILGIVGAVALLMFVWGGATWMLAAGSPEQVGKAKKMITWAVLGLVAIFSSYAVLSFVINALQ